MTLQSLQSIRSDECFDLFWEYIERRRSLADVSSPTLPRLRKAPRRYEIGESAPEHPSSVQDHYRRIYFESIDLAVAAITARFHQKGFQMLHKLETVLNNIKQPQHPEMVKDVLTFYGSNFHQSDRLKTQLHQHVRGKELSRCHFKVCNQYDLMSALTCSGNTLNADGPWLMFHLPHFHTVGKLLDDTK